MNSVLHWLWLTEKVKSNKKIGEITEYFETIENIYNSKGDELIRVCGSELAAVLRDKSLEKAEKIYSDTLKCGAYIITYDSEEYPAMLKSIYDPPYVLYARGNLSDWGKLVSIGVVGTRRCDNYGAEVTYEICKELAGNNVIIVSGLAYGIDSVAAKAALEEGMPTIAVVGNGIDSIYPPGNEELFRRIENSGLILSEYPPGFGVKKWTFPARNRIISGISSGVLVTQAPAKSGALITAREAMENGRDVFAVPGSIYNKNCEGTNRLIKDGAIPVLSAADILNEYPEFEMRKPILINCVKDVDKEKKDKEIKEESLKTEEKYFPGLTDTQVPICECIARGIQYIDEIARELKIPVSVLSSELVMLEISGIVESQPGNKYELTINKY